MKSCEKDIIEDIYTTHFTSVWAAVEFYLTKAPTRQEPLSIESQGGCKPSFDDLDPRHPARIWTTLAIGFPKVFNDLNAVEQMAYRWIFKFYHPSWGFPEIAKYHGVNERHLSRSKRYVLEKLEDFLISRDLMEKPEHWQPAERTYFAKGKAGRPKKDLTA